MIISTETIPVKDYSLMQTIMYIDGTACISTVVINPTKGEYLSFDMDIIEVDPGKYDICNGELIENF